MYTCVFHFDTAQICQGSCTAPGDFLFKEEPHYAVEEVLAKNTCRDLPLSASAGGQLDRLRSAPAAAQSTGRTSSCPTRQWRLSLSVSTSPLTSARTIERLFTVA